MANPLPHSDRRFHNTYDCSITIRQGRLRHVANEIFTAAI
jgi:hypothetical protein